MPHAVVQGRKLYYELHGEDPRPPLVLAMGVGGSCRGWLAVQVPELSRRRRVLIFDYPGVGSSEGDGAAFGTGDLADVLADARTVLKDRGYRVREGDGWVAAERGYLDDVIDPRETRARLISGLEMLADKRQRNPPKKHGNIPL